MYDFGKCSLGFRRFFFLILSFTSLIKGWNAIESMRSTNEYRFYDSIKQVSSCLNSALCLQTISINHCNLCFCLRCKLHLIIQNPMLNGNISFIFWEDD